MACNCYEDLQKRMEERVKETLGGEMHTLEECDFTNSMYVLAQGDHSRVVVPFKIRYVKRKKNGEPEKRTTNGDSFIVIQYCPFCGTKFEGKDAN